MKNESDFPRFKVIRAPKREFIHPEAFLEAKHQGNLFPTPRPGLLIFVHFPDVTGEEFRNALTYGKPSKVLELRSAPRFDIGTLNRKAVFDLFEQEHATYIDLTPSGQRWDIERLLTCVQSFVRASHLSAERPMMILLNKSDLGDAVTDPIRRLITAARPEFTEYFEIPNFVRSEVFKAKSTSA